MVPPEPISYRFERRDAWQLGRLLFRPTWKGRLFRLAFVLVCLIGGPVIGAGSWPSLAEWRALLSAPAVLVAALALIVLSQSLHLLNVATLWLRYRQLSVADKPITLTFFDDRIETEAGGAHGAIPWTTFVSRAEEPDRVFLKLSRWEALTIPRRAAPDDSAWHALLSFLREKVSRP